MKTYNNHAITRERERESNSDQVKLNLQQSNSANFAAKFLVENIWTQNFLTQGIHFVLNPHNPSTWQFSRFFPKLTCQNLAQLPHKNDTLSIPQNRLYIIIPIYNVAPYLRECLDSIAAQTYSNLKAIMIDDCSSDDSIQIAQQYATNDKRFILIQKPQNEGIGMARNTGLDYVFTTLKPSNSDYIGFADSDDVVAVDYFENLIFCLESHKKHGIAVAKSYNPYRFKHKSYNKAIFAYRAKKSKGRVTTKCQKIAQWLTLYRAPFLEHLRFPNARFLGEDIVFGNIANAMAGQIAYTRKARYFYRQREGSLVRQWNYSFDECFANFEYMLGAFVKFDLLKTHRIDISLVANMPQGAEDLYFAKLQNLVCGYNFSEAILRINPHLRAIIDSKTYAEFHAKIANLTPLKQRMKRYFRIDIRMRKIYIKLFGKVLVDKVWR